jgi:hypothetical protein
MKILLLRSSSKTASGLSDHQIQEAEAACRTEEDDARGDTRKVCERAYDGQESKIC